MPFNLDTSFAIPAMPRAMSAPPVAIIAEPPGVHAIFLAILMWNWRTSSYPATVGAIHMSLVTIHAALVSGLLIGGIHLHGHDHFLAV